MVLDESAIDRARHSLDKGSLSPEPSTWRKELIKLLNTCLATELVCVLRYKRHHFTAHGLASPRIADEFMVHANEEAAPRRSPGTAHRPARGRARLFP